MMQEKIHEIMNFSGGVADFIPARRFLSPL